MPEVHLYVDLLSHTLHPESIVATGARICYSGATVENLQSKVEKNDQSEFLHRLRKQHHFSPIEHASFTFGVQGVSRALLAQITRHRLASFSVQSQRYVSQEGHDGFNYIVPPSIRRLGVEAVKQYHEQMQQINTLYLQWNAQLGAEGKEDARFVLPNACETRFVMTMNARELLHFLELRACERAQWEIRALAWAVWGHLLRISPAIFADAGPSCHVGACGEGGMSCQKQHQVKRRAQAMKAFVAKNGDKKDFSRHLCQWAEENVASEIIKLEKKNSEWNFYIRKEEKD